MTWDVQVLAWIGAITLTWWYGRFLLWFAGEYEAMKEEIRA